MKATEEDQAKLPFKFKSLRIYSSTEWLADNKKKYRQVYDQSELSFVYVELCLANLNYEREEWPAKFELKCYDSKKNVQVCHLVYDKIVPRSNQLVFIREGWGNNKTKVWRRGTYYWEAWYEGNKIATKYFYIEDSPVKPQEPKSTVVDKYVSVQNIQLFEGGFEEVPEEHRKYLKVFNAEETRYVYTDIELNNLHPRRKWHCEVFIKFYNYARELKGQVVKLVKVQSGDDSIFITAGWGSNRPGNWRPGKYTAEFVFMDHLIAIVSFEIGNHSILGDARLFLPDWPSFLMPQSAESEQEFQNWNLKLHDLIGLQEIKEKVMEHSMYIKFLKLRRAKGIKDSKPISIHSAFVGNPGTGKTTVAKMIGKLYQNMGLLSKGHVHEVDRSDLVGEYIGQTAPKVKEAIENARGGVLFIDEAYSLMRKNDDSKDFGKEVIEILVKELSNGPGDLAVIVAGYPEEMKYFLESNPGLKSRFKHIFEFTDYLPSELIQIADYIAEREKVKLSSGARNAIEYNITRAFRDRDRTFGNARYVEDLIEKSKINLGLRVMRNESPEALSKRVLQTILKDDVTRTEERRAKPKLRLPIDNIELALAMKELDALIGLKAVKKNVKELVKLVEFHLASGDDVLNYFNLHTLFIGNPGTGKTTVARILTRIYKALGIIERGKLVETDRQGLVAGFVGQTAIKTNKVINTAQGGILFIDEAYALTQASGNHGSDFGNEVIQTLIKRMEDQKGEFFLFAAGYPQNMETFLNSNPGFKSRFDQLLYFEDYSESELLEIFIRMIDAEGYKIKKAALQLVKMEIKDLHLKRDKYFGNARRIRLMASQVVRNQNLRVSHDKNAERSVITQEDVLFESVSPSEWRAKKSNIGFQSSND